MKHIFSADIIGGKISFKTDEILAVKWLTFEDVKDINEDGMLRRPWVWDIIKKDHLDIM